MNLRVPYLPGGRYHNVTGMEIVGVIALVRIGDTVFSVSRPLHLAHSYRVNDKVRRAYCRLAGVQFKDLKAAVKADLAERESSEQAREVARLRSDARKRGYTLVKGV